MSARLLLIALALCLWLPAEVSAQDVHAERKWTGKNGASFTGTFVEVDDATGKLRFLTDRQKRVLVARGNLSDDDLQWIEEQLQESEDLAGFVQLIDSQRELFRPDMGLVFFSDADGEREWMDRHGRVITGTILGVDDKELELRIKGARTYIPLDTLSDADRTAVRMWQGATNDSPLPKSGVYHYQVFCAGRVVTSFTIELLDKRSRILMVDHEGQRREKKEATQFRLTTDHDSGAFQIETFTDGVGWRLTGVGKWERTHQLGVLMATAEQQQFLDGMGQAEVRPAVHWLARHLSVTPPALAKDGVGEVDFLVFPESLLPAALRVMCGTHELEVPADGDDSGDALVAQTQRVFSHGVVTFNDQVDQVLAALQMVDCVPVRFTYQVRPAGGGRPVLMAEVRMTQAGLLPPDDEVFVIDSAADGMVAGSYREIR